MKETKPNIIIRFLENNITKWVINILFIIVFLCLLTCSILYFIFSQHENLNENFKKIWSGVLAILTILNTPLTILKMKLLIHNQIMAKRKRQLLMKEYYEKLKIENTKETIMKQKEFLKNLTNIEKLELWCSENGKKVEGITHYLILDIDKNIKDRKHKINQLKDCLLKYHNYNEEELYKQLKNAF